MCERYCMHWQSTLEFFALAIDAAEMNGDAVHADWARRLLPDLVKHVIRGLHG